MARQKGVVKLEGQVGDLVFYRNKDGYFAREKGGVDGDRIRNDPNFERTRENGAEFGRANAAGKLLRGALRSVLLRTGDSRMSNRLTQVLMRVIQQDATNLRGQRNVIDGEVSLLKGFEFNDNGKVGSAFHAPYSAQIDRAAGTLTVTIPAFVPRDMVVAPAGATHIRLLTVGLEVDFETRHYVVDQAVSADIALQLATQDALVLTTEVTAASAHPLLLAFGVEFYQFVNGDMYPLKNGTFNGLLVTEVDGGV